jgi:ATP-dependent protease Clp ATPase subunit
MAKPPPPPTSAERCAFCGRREIEAGRLIAGAKAAICADCIRKLGEGLKGGARHKPR